MNHYIVHLIFHMFPTIVFARHYQIHEIHGACGDVRRLKCSQHGIQQQWSEKKYSVKY